MQKFNFKSKKGFTLIELLVVIGILAVLAAIAIPSVAGLIDRANVSADDTNANEMTNAIERFASEYELVCQDIASGRFDIDDLDSAQSRVYNSTGIKDRSTIEALENGDLSGKGINRDTKYPINALTTKSIVENYTKTSSATYDPKQSDMHFYYSPDCGVVVVDEATVGEPNVTELNKLIISGKDAKGKELSSSTVWINLSTSDVSMETPVEPDLNLSHGNIIPVGGQYIIATSGEIREAGQEFPVPQVGDEYRYDDYGYVYKKDKDTSGNFTFTSQGWGVYVLDKTKETYSSPLESICDTNVVGMRFVYKGCKNLKYLDANYRLPSQTDNLMQTFLNCRNLEFLPDTFIVPESVTDMRGTFSNCEKLGKLSPNFTIPVNCIATSSLFKNCSALVTLPNGFKIPNGVYEIDWMFSGCTSLKNLNSDFTMPMQIESTSGCSNMFANCTSLETLPASFKLPVSVCGEYGNMFKNCSSLNLPAGIFTLEMVNSQQGITTEGMFEGCSSLTSFPINSFTADGCVHDNMYAGCTNITGTVIITSDGDFAGFVDGTTKSITVKYSEDFQLSQISDTCENTNITYIKN